MTPSRTAGIALAWLLLLAFGCTRTSTAPAETPPSGTASHPPDQGSYAEIGRPELAFDYKSVSELTLSKANPIQSDSWSARLIRGENPAAPAAFAWFIESGPAGREIADRWANGPFILHLLDTIRTVQAREIPLSGDPGSFGLSPPWYDLRWSLSTETPEPEHELALGAPVQSSDGSFSGLYGKIISPSNPRLFAMNGALLKMLELLPDFNSIRLPRLATFDANEVDEIEVFRGGRRVFRARRAGSRWTATPPSPHGQDVEAWLQMVTHLRIQRFIDDPARADDLLRRRLRHPPWSLRFRGANLKSVTIGLTQGRDVDATISTRPNAIPHHGRSLAVFELYPRAGELISTLLAK